MAALAVAGLCADRLDRVVEIHLSGPLENQRALEAVALLKRTRQPDEHEVKRPGLELDRLPRLDLETILELAHPHHALVHLRGVDLDPFASLGRAADQAIRGCTIVAKRRVAGRHRRTLRRRARPWIGDLDRAGLV